MKHDKSHDTVYILSKSESCTINIKEGLYSTLVFSDPGYEGGGGDSSGMFQLALILVLWIVIAVLLFIFR